MADIWDVKAAFIAGPSMPSGKCRVLWSDDRLKAFNATGCNLDIECTAPTRKPKHLRTWIANTEHGEITITEKCWSCGGWWRIASVSAEKLWG